MPQLVVHGGEKNGAWVIVTAFASQNVVTIRQRAATEVSAVATIPLHVGRHF